MIIISSKKVIVICGATASGKTYCAIETAKILDGEIINADSMQIYKDINVGTAKPTESEKQGIPHHLIDIKELSETFSVAEYVKLANKKISEILKRGKQPIVCGGTGLYIDHLIRNTKFTEYENDYSLRKRLDEKTNDDLHDLLLQVDSESASIIHKNNRQRVIRALEIFYITGQKKSILDKKAFESKSDFVFSKIYLNYPDRNLLYNRIDARTDEMINAGLPEEILDLAQNAENNVQCINNIKRINAIGYNEIIEFFETNGFEFNTQIKISEEFNEVIERIKRNTRNYAKRQITWFKKDINNIIVNINDEMLRKPQLIREKVIHMGEQLCLKME